MEQDVAPPAGAGRSQLARGEVDTLSVCACPVAKRVSRTEAVEQGGPSALAALGERAVGRVMAGQDDIQTATIECRRKVDALGGCSEPLDAGLAESP